MPDSSRGAQVAQAVRAVVRRIPRGCATTYGDIAKQVGCTARQVGWALRQSGPERLPWHRVVAAQGRIALPGAAGMEQRLRLEQEGVPFRGRRVWLDRCRPPSP